MDWKTVKDHGPPPYDTQVVVKGTKSNDHGSWPVYAIAFNQCYPPHMSMTQCLELPEMSYATLSFEVEAWCELE